MNTSLGTLNNLKVKVGGKDLLFSGVVHIDQTECLIEIENLKLVFIFKDDDGQSRYEGKVEDDRLNIYLINHKNSLGEGTFSPLEIGTLKNRKLYVTYFVFSTSPEENKRVLEFAFYLGEPV